MLLLCIKGKLSPQASPFLPFPFLSLSWFREHSGDCGILDKKVDATFGHCPPEESMVCAESGSHDHAGFMNDEVARVFADQTLANNKVLAATLFTFPF